MKIINQYQDLNNSDIDNNKNSPIKKKPTTDINILLNRVKLDKKRESIKKILFSAAASAGVLIFGVLIF